MDKIIEIARFMNDLDRKTKTNLICLILISVTLSLAAISILTPEMIEFTKPVFVAIWSVMTMMNVVIYWVVVTITDYWNEKEMIDEE